MLDDLLEKLRLSLMPHDYFLLGTGPKHPIAPNIGLASSVMEHLSRFPNLKKDSEYAEFLLKYSGLYIFRNPDLSVDLTGFSDISTNYSELDASMYITPDGFLAFCDMYFIPSNSTDNDKIISLGFAYAISSLHAPGIYQSTLVGNDMTRMNRVCTSFTEWLEILIQAKGKPLLGET